MKAFWASVILFAVLIACIWANAVYMQKTAQAMHSLSAKLNEPQQREATLAKLEEAWENSRTVFSLTVGYRELDRFDEILTQLRWAYESKNAAEFTRFHRLLEDAIDELIRTERFEIENLL